MRSVPKAGRSSRTPRYGLGQSAQQARTIAAHLVEALGETRLDGPQARRLIFEAAKACPLVKNDEQAWAVVHGWEGSWHLHGAGFRVAICRSAGRQLAVLKGVLS